MKNFDEFLILEKYDANLKTQFKSMGITDEKELNTLVQLANQGNLRNYLNKNGQKFTFGMLLAIFNDAVNFKKRADIRLGAVKMIYRIIPIALAPFFPIIAIAGYILGTSRAFNKIVSPILNDPGKTFPEFLTKIVSNSMKIAEGELVESGDKFTRCFVVGGNLVEIIRIDILQKFALHLGNKMSKKDPDEEVPDNYIENELRKYLNRKYDINPALKLIRKREIT